MLFYELRCDTNYVLALPIANKVQGLQRTYNIIRSKASVTIKYGQECKSKIKASEFTFERYIINSEYISNIILGTIGF